ncbi:uncharacterized protein LOC132038077 [Lycium ferocissimum]|uniref:uncharacterized protein LOC132038077 n=1 Tax=Lycium ferocissimum TaxID=112874 RepID=UPI002815959E|nr:uncharacterized protein LOC132038077 [Lycium ferocissimum]
MVSELLKRKIICDRKDEIWINYRGMPPAPDTQGAKKAKGSKAKNDVSLVNLVGKSYTQKKLLQDLESKTFSKKHKEALCLVWFVHSVLWARDVNYNIPLGLIKLAEDYDAFNNYAWGFQSFSLTVEYLMKHLKPTGKTQNLYGFPWAFMAWAFEAIPHLRHQVKEYSEEVTYPRILRWLTARNNTKLSVDLFNPPKEARSIRTQQMTRCCKFL